MKRHLVALISVIAIILLRLLIFTTVPLQATTPGNFLNLLCVTDSLNCQQRVHQELLHTNKQYQFADSLYRKEDADYPVVIEQYQKVLMGDLDFNSYHQVANRIGYCFVLSSDFDGARTMLITLLNKIKQESQSCCDQTLAETHAILGECYHYIGNSLNDNTGYEVLHCVDSANLYLNKALKFYLDQDNLKINVVCNILSVLGEVHRNLERDYLQAMQYYEQAYEIGESNNPPIDFVRMGYLYGLSCTAKDQGDYQKAQVYASRLFEMADSISDGGYLPLTFTLLGNIASSMGDYEQALEYTNLAIQSNLDTKGNSIDLHIYYNNQADALRLLGRFDEALRFCDKAIDLANGKSIHLQKYLVTLAIKGQVLYAQGDYEQAQGILKDCLQQRLNLFGPKHRYVSRIYHYLGQVSCAENELDSALMHYQQALIAGSVDFSETSFDKNPNIDDIEGNKDLIQVLKDKSDALFWHSQNDSGHQVSFLQLAFNCLLRCDELISKTWRLYHSEGAKLQLEQAVQSIYDQALFIGYELYQSGKQADLLPEIFRLLEHSRYRYLTDNILLENAFSQLYVNNDLFVRLRQIEFELGKMQLTGKEGLDLSAEENRKKFKLTREKDEIDHQIGNALQNNAVSAQETGLLSHRQVKRSLKKHDCMLIEYYEEAHNWFVFGSTGNQDTMIRVTKSKELEEAIMGLVWSIDPKQIGSTPGSTSDLAFHRNAHIVYQNLLHEILTSFSEFSGHNLLIIPDGPLSGISFDALVMDLDSLHPNNSGNERFVIQDYTVSYGFSANQVLNHRKIVPKNRPQLLGFSYGYVSNDNRGYDQLYAANLELDAIPSVFVKKIFKDAEATKINFKQSIDNQDIIHLALHGEAGVSTNDSTVLIFRSGVDDASDGELHAFELLSLPIHADLVVLSSCKSGLGKNQAGEGIYSMARAFAYCGVPAIVSTLWSLSDYSSMLIMKEFYSSLSHGASVNQALRDAKLDYLTQANIQMQHPMFWASFVSVGQLDAVMVQGQKNKGLLNLILISGLILCSLIVLIVMKKSVKNG